MGTTNPKRVNEKVQRTLAAWQTLRPEKSYAGMTLAQFQAKVQPVVDSHTQVETLRDQLRQARDTRRLSSLTSNATTKLVVNAVKGDPQDGEDSPFYAALGYVQASARKSGLIRKANQTANAGQTVTNTSTASAKTA